MAHPQADEERIEVREIEQSLAESGRNGVNIVVVGETGAGKSTLVNGLIGTDAIKKAKAGRSATSVTRTVDAYQVKRGVFKLTVFDTPCLFDARSGTLINREVFAEIAELTEGRIDLVVYCHDMRTRLRITDIEAIGSLSKILHQSNAPESSLWENVMYVLTFANKVEQDLREDRTHTQEEPVPSVEQEFVNNLEEYRKTLHKRIQKAISKEELEVLYNAEELVRNIPVVPAGYRKASLPDCKDWVTALLKATLLRVKATTAPAFIETTALDTIQPAARGADPDQSQRESTHQSCEDDESHTPKRVFTRRAVIVLSFGIAVLLIGAGIGYFSGLHSVLYGAKRLVLLLVSPLYHHII